jgi:hypothetical protein
MPGTTSDTPPGSSVGGGFQSDIGWPYRARMVYGPYTKQAADFYAGPDAQGPMQHRTWDPGDAAVDGWRINLCAHPQFEWIEEIPPASGTPFSADMVRQFERKFRVMARYATLGPTAVCSCPGVPWPYSAYIPGRAGEYDLLARVVRISADREKATDFRAWIVTVGYSTAMPEGGPIPAGLVDLGSVLKGAQNNPWDEPPHLEWDPETETKTPLADLDQKPFRNSAGQLIYPAPVVEEGVAVLVISRNMRFTTLEACRAHIERFSYVVNFNAFLGALRGQILCLPPKAVEMYRGPLRYWRFTYRLKFKKRESALVTWLQSIYPYDTWQPKMLDAGQFEKRESWLGFSDALVPIIKGGAAVNYPVPLKDGKEAPVGTANWLNFKYYPEEDFSDLILPDSKL